MSYNQHINKKRGYDFWTSVQGMASREDPSRVKQTPIQLSGRYCINETFQVARAIYMTLTSRQTITLPKNVTVSEEEGISKSANFLRDKAIYGLW